ncbi:DPP IV N-terminal domain-containing protein [Ramlibacter solisilvae]
MLSGLAVANDDLAVRYERAAALSSPQVSALVQNGRVVPHWTGNGGKFWYSRRTSQGVEYVQVDPDGTRQLAFDHGQIAHAVSAATGVQASATSLLVEEIDFPSRISLTHAQKKVICELPSTKCMVDAVPPKQPTVSLSPNGRSAVFTRTHNLWVRDESSGAERQLTRDGVDGFAWGDSPDILMMSIPRQRYGVLPFPPYGVLWAGNGFIVATRADERTIQPTWYFEPVPQDGSFLTKVWPVRQAQVGDKPPTAETIIVNAKSGSRVALSDPDLAVDEVLFSSDEQQHFVALARSDSGRTLVLAEIDAITGTVRKIHSERPDGFVNVNSQLYAASNIRVIRGGREVLWYSERSGFGHLYRYRISDGALLSVVTRGDWLVKDIIHVDEGRNRLFFTAVGHDAANPYWRRLFRVNFDGTDLRDLTPESADHEFDGPPHPLVVRLLGLPTQKPLISPDGRVFIDTASTLSQPPVTTLRSTEDGHVIATLERADATALLSTGWRPPVPFVAKAADGKTSLYGSLYLPEGSENAPAGSIPLIDAIYGGPQTTVAPQNFFQGSGSTLTSSHPSSIRALGFAVFVVDGRGTPLRSKAFHNEAFRSNFADAEIDDHVAVVKQLVETHKFLDGSRIGIYGHSFGGYVTVRAMLRYPDVYKVGVSSAGIHSVQTTYASLGTYLPIPVYSDGSQQRPSPQSVPENYRQMDNTLLARRLSGKLLLAYGDLDENAPVAGTAHLIDALVKADRRFDLLYLPNRAHGFAAEPYFKRRLWDYFVEHLLHQPLPNLSTDAH